MKRYFISPMGGVLLIGLVLILGFLSGREEQGDDKSAGKITVPNPRQESFSEADSNPSVARGCPYLKQTGEDGSDNLDDGITLAQNGNARTGSKEPCLHCRGDNIECEGCIDMKDYPKEYSASNQCLYGCLSERGPIIEQSNGCDEYKECRIDG